MLLPRPAAQAPTERFPQVYGERQVRTIRLHTDMFVSLWQSSTLLCVCPPRPPFPRRCDVISVLNLRAKMVTTDPVDRDRVFIIYFYLCDDSICVFEQPQKNSGKKNLKEV